MCLLGLLCLSWRIRLKPVRSLSSVGFWEWVQVVDMGGLVSQDGFLGIGSWAIKLQNGLMYSVLIFTNFKLTFKFYFFLSFLLILLPNLLFFFLKNYSILSESSSNNVPFGPDSCDVSPKPFTGWKCNWIFSQFRWAGKLSRLALFVCFCVSLTPLCYHRFRISLLMSSLPLWLAMPLLFSCCDVLCLVG